MIKINDYIEGTEYYGFDDNTQRIRGWVDKIRETEEGLQIDIQCDDCGGHRGSTVYEKLGNIIILESQERPIIFNFDFRI